MPSSSRSSGVKAAILIGVVCLVVALVAYLVFSPVSTKQGRKEYAAAKDGAVDRSSQQAGAKIGRGPVASPKPDVEDGTAAHSLPGTATKDTAGFDVADKFAGPAVQVKGTVLLPDGKAVALEADALGVFQRVLVQPRQHLKITLTYPAGQPGDSVVASVRDGGDLPGNHNMEVAQLDGQRQVTTEFTVGQNRGIYHVEFRRGHDVKVFRAWAGPEPL